MMIADNSQVSGNANVSSNAWVYGIMRSDGYCFVYVPCSDGVMRVIAGCRYFTMKEARQHWGSKDYPYPNLARETLVILDCLEALSKVKPEGAV
jgi:hypothetical protein